MAEILITESGRKFTPVTEWSRIEYDAKTDAWGIWNEETDKLYMAEDIDANVPPEPYRDDDGCIGHLQFFKDGIAFQEDLQWDFGRLLKEITEGDKA